MRDLIGCDGCVLDSRAKDGSKEAEDWKRSVARWHADYRLIHWKTDPVRCDEIRDMPFTGRVRPRGTPTWPPDRVSAVLVQSSQENGDIHQVYPDLESFAIKGPPLSKLRSVAWITILVVFALVPLNCVLSFRNAIVEFKNASRMIEALGGYVGTSGDGASSLHGVAGVHEIYLSDYLTRSRVKDADLERLQSSLARMKRLRTLLLDCENITDKGLAHLQCLNQLPNLRFLSLAGTQVTDVGLSNLEGFTNLAELRLSNSKVTLDGAKLLKKSLVNTKITLGKDKL